MQVQTIIMVCLEFVGFFMRYCKFEVELSERRTNWIVQ